MSLVAGILVGLVLGLTGAGGSILAVPLLMAGLGWSLPQAAPVALLAVAASSLFGTMTAWGKSYVRYRAAGLMAIAGWITAPFGLQAAHALPHDALLLVFAAVMVAVGVRLFRQAVKHPEEAAVVRADVHGEGEHSHGPACKLDAVTGRILWTRPCVVVMAALGAFTGFLSGLLGVGGGFVIVPGLRFATELSMHSAVATSLMAIALVAGGAVVSAVASGVAFPVAVALPFVGGALLGMGLGRTVAPRIAGPRLQEGFGALMIAVALGIGGHAIGWF